MLIYSLYLEINKSEIYGTDYLQTLTFAMLTRQQQFAHYGHEANFLYH